MGDQYNNPAAARRKLSVFIIALAVFISGFASASSAQSGRAFQYGVEPELNPLYPRWMITVLPLNFDYECRTELSLMAASKLNRLPVNMENGFVLLEGFDASGPKLPSIFPPPNRIDSPAQDWTRKWVISLDLGPEDTAEAVLAQYGFELASTSTRSGATVWALAPVGADVVGIREDPRVEGYGYSFGEALSPIDRTMTVEPGTYVLAISNEALAQNPDCVIGLLNEEAQRLEQAGAEILNVPADDLEIVFRADQAVTYDEQRPLNDINERIFTSTRVVDDAPRCGGLPVTVDLAAGDVPTAGDDVILGTDGDDQIAAGDGDDVVCGLGGDDTIFGQAGNDYILGGDGKDTLRGGKDNDVLLGQGGADNINGSRGDDVVSGGDGDDAVRGGVDDDVVLGGAGNDTQVSGNGGLDVVLGGAGDDTMSGGPRVDVMYGSDGADTMRGLGGPDTLFGGDGDDLLYGGKQPDRLFGGLGENGCGYGAGSPIADWSERCARLDPPAPVN